MRDENQGSSFVYSFLMSHASLLRSEAEERCRFSMSFNAKS